MDPIAVVTGFRGRELEAELKDSGVILIRNEQYASTEMLDSLRLGFGAIADCATRFWLCRWTCPR